MAERLRRLKDARGVRKWADQLGLSPSLLSSYLNGGRLPNTETLRAISDRTGVSLDWLLFGEGGEEPAMRGQWRT
ncbi:MAG: helix-turn-helix domain-containing protein, partial [Gemmatimonadales bacterium]|nr:helix-turn-helix domain-containing protein [Gemmatimonadales bacterium]